MSQGASLNILYAYKNVNVVNGRFNADHMDSFSSYQILKAISEVERLETGFLKKIYTETFKRAPLEGMYLGPFEELSELNQYALKLSSELKLPVIHLLSVFDYNRALESINNVKGLDEIFSHYGKKLLNPNFVSDKSNFFKRIFKDS